MMASVRTSRRAMFGAVLSGMFVVITLFAVKDMHDKLGVMTASNTGYQKMIDTQNEKITKLNQELRDSKDSHKWDVDSFQKKGADSLAKVRKAEERVTMLKNQLERTRKELEHLHHTHETELTQMEQDLARMRRANQDLRQAKESREQELRQQIAKANNELENCKAQYVALYKQHQDSKGELLKAQSEKANLEGAQETKKTSSAAAKAASLNLEDLSVEKLPPLALKQQTSNSPPVAAEPPLAKGQKSQMAPQVHQEEEEVMESPNSMQRPLEQPGRKIIYGQVKQPGSAGNQDLDQEVDNLQQDHPNLPGPLDTGRLDHGLQQQEEENEADDAVDGRIPHQNINGFGRMGSDDFGNFGYDQNEMARGVRRQGPYFANQGQQRALAQPQVRRQDHPQLVYGHRGL